MAKFRQIWSHCQHRGKAAKPNETFNLIPKRSASSTKVIKNELKWVWGKDKPKLRRRGLNR